MLACRKNQGTISWENNTLRFPLTNGGTRSLVNPNDSARWLALADTALRMGATEVVVVEEEILACNEQAAIKKRFRRTAEQVKRQSKSKQ